MNVNDLMNMNDMYYVGNIVDVDGNGWVTKAEAQAILDELMGDDDHKATLQQDEQRYSDKKYGDESADEYKRMMAQVGIKLK
jgi:ribosome assembly protein YihI (activator of Der GTPase)